MAKEKLNNNILIKNKRATFDYELLETFTAGIVLTGTEIKSLRLGKASLVDTYCYVERGEVWVKNMNISEYFYGTYNNHAARRDRKLLLNKKEILALLLLNAFLFDDIGNDFVDKGVSGSGIHCSNAQ